ncbi:MAG: hypothetical protein R6V41_11250, partial [Desulfobacteraceae bacterium]
SGGVGNDTFKPAGGCLEQIRINQAERLRNEGDRPWVNGINPREDQCRPWKTRWRKPDSSLRDSKAARSLSSPL